MEKQPSLEEKEKIVSAEVAKLDLVKERHIEGVRNTFFVEGLFWQEDIKPPWTQQD